MAVALRSSFDLVYLPDHGFVAEDGALRILINVNRQIRRIDISHNVLGLAGIGVLLGGLSTLRSRYAAGEGGWGIKEMNLAANDLDDAALEAVAGYAKRDEWLGKLLLQGNRIELKSRLDNTMTLINESHLTTLSLNTNPLDADAAIRFFETLALPTLTDLHLSSCGLPPEAAEAIAGYLASERCGRLVRLELNGNRLGAQGVRRIVDVIERYNFTILHVGLFSNDLGVAMGLREDREDETPNHHGDDGLGVRGGETRENGPGRRDTRTSEQKAKDASILEYTVHQRLPELLARNRTRTRRIRSAALRAIAPARIVLRGRPPTDEETAKEVIQDIGERKAIRQFPILNLPREVIYHIVRHASGDASAFSSAQFARLRTHAEDPRSCIALAETTGREMKAGGYGEEDRVRWEVRERWLKEGGWDRWDSDRTPRGAIEPDEPRNEGVWVALGGGGVE